MFFRKTADPLHTHKERLYDIEYGDSDLSSFMKTAIEGVSFFFKWMFPLFYGQNWARCFEDNILGC